MSTDDMCLRLIDLSASYRNKRKETLFSLKPVTFSVPKGHCLALSGPSGAGKSTLLKAMAGLLESNGDLLYDDHPLSIDETAYMGEIETLYRGKSIFESLAFPMKMAKLDEVEIKERIYHIANDLGFINLLTRNPKELSLGQKKIIEFSKCVLKSPDVILLDEPFASVDPKTRKILWLYVNQMKRDLETTFVIASHDEEETISLSDDIFDFETYIIRSFNKDKHETAN